MKRLLTLLFCLPLLSLAQNMPLVAEGVYPKLYLTHTVQPKENFYSLGRMYNISPKEIAPFNNLQLDKGLNLNEAIKVPLTPANFVQTGSAAADEALVPVYHAMQDKEGLYRVSVNYNKLPLETLKKWNNIKGDAVPNGTNLIVGYLKVKKELSGLATLSKTKPADITAPAISKKEPTVITNEPVVTTKKDTPEPPKETASTSIKPVVTKDAEPIPQAPVSMANTKTFDGGIFKKDFDKQAKSETVVSETGGAAIFKSNSGWSDGKYYCLHNNAPSGTIIKITSVSTGKSIYAKVLDVIPDMKQNNGLLIRISNAAVHELGVGDGKFDCTVVYSK